MRDWYDNPRLEDILDEQAQVLPRGPLGLLEPPEVSLEGLPQEVVALVKRYLAGELGSLQFAAEMEAHNASDKAVFTP
jgi:hypothetical protein